LLPKTIGESLAFGFAKAWDCDPLLSPISHKMAAQKYGGDAPLKSPQKPNWEEKLYTALVRSKRCQGEVAQLKSVICGVYQCRAET